MLLIDGKWIWRKLSTTEDREELGEINNTRGVHNFVAMRAQQSMEDENWL